MNDASLGSLYSSEMQQPNTSLITGKHTQLLYERLSRKEAGILAQLRTGMASLNVYLHRIGVAPSDQYACHREYTTSSSDAEDGRHTERRCSNAQTPTEATFPSI